MSHQKIWKYIQYFYKSRTKVLLFIIFYFFRKIKNLKPKWPDLVINPSNWRCRYRKLQISFLFFKRLQEYCDSLRFIFLFVSYQTSALRLFSFSFWVKFFGYSSSFSHSGHMYFLVPIWVNLDSSKFLIKSKPHSLTVKLVESRIFWSKMFLFK